MCSWMWRWLRIRKCVANCGAECVAGSTFATVFLNVELNLALAPNSRIHVNCVCNHPKYTYVKSCLNCLDSLLCAIYCINDELANINTNFNNALIVRQCSTVHERLLLFYLACQWMFSKSFTFWTFVIVKIIMFCIVFLIFVHIHACAYQWNTIF